MANRETEELLWIFGTGLDRLADEQPGRPKVAGSRYWEPRIDLLVEEHRFLIRAELAGVRPEDITLTYIPERHVVQLRGVRIDDFQPDTRVGAHQLEVLFGEFFREISLPDRRVDASGIRAQYRNGFLMIMIPILERARTRITIQKI